MRGRRKRATAQRVCALLYEALASHSSRYAGVDDSFVLVLSASPPDSVAGGHSDFSDPKGPLLAPDFHIPQGYRGEALAS